MLDSYKDKTDKLTKVLFTDIDYTFFDRREIEATKLLSRYLNQRGWKLVYVTGRNLEQVLELEDLPKAIAIAVSMGTEIYFLQNDKYVPDQEFRKILAPNWDWKEVTDAVRKVQSLFKELKVQPSYKLSHQTEEYRLSLYFHGTAREAKKIALGLKAILTKVHIEASRDLTTPGKFDIDLYPIACYGRQKEQLSGKNLAVKFIANRINVEGLVAGDGVNDREMIFHSGFPAILVGEAHQDLLEKVLSFKVIKDKVRLLPNGQKIFVGVKGEDNGAVGIMHALEDPFFKLIRRNENSSSGPI